MRVARLHGTGDVRIHDEPDPADPALGHSLVHVTAVGICGSDLHWFGEGGIGDAKLSSPLALGHEFAGVISSGPKAGTRVAVDPAIPCGVCPSCHRGHHNLCPAVRFAGHGETDGALREYMVWPDHLLHPLPVEISDIGGALLEPLGVALHAVSLGKVRLGCSVAIVGCGPIGLLAIQLVRAAGVTSVLAVEPLAHRREAAIAAGADAVYAPTDHPFETGAGVDVVIEIAGTDDAIDIAMLAARPGGCVVLAGIPDTDRSTFRASVARRKGLTILMSRRMNDTYPRCIELVRSGLVTLDRIVTERYELGEAQKAFAAATARTGLKTVITVRHD